MVAARCAGRWQVGEIVFLLSRHPVFADEPSLVPRAIAPWRFIVERPNSRSRSRKRSDCQLPILRKIRIEIGALEPAAHGVLGKFSKMTTPAAFQTVVEIVRDSTV
jgi:hypothetical protein